MNEIARWFYIVFFAIHIPTTLLVDSQALFPPALFPDFAKKTLQNFINDYKDPLMSPPRDVWFISLVWTEVLAQLPFFFVAVYAFSMKKEWIRVPAAIYGGFVCATMVPILTVLATHTGVPGYQSTPLLAMYAPYAIVPGILAIHMVLEQDGRMFRRDSVTKLKTG